MQKSVYNIATYSHEPETRHQLIDRVFEDELNPAKVVRSRSTHMDIAGFFRYTKHIATIALEDPKIVNADCYKNFFCKKSLITSGKNNRKHHIILYDNASSRTAHHTINY